MDVTAGVFGHFLRPTLLTFPPGQSDFDTQSEYRAFLTGRHNTVLGE